MSAWASASDEEETVATPTMRKMAAATSREMQATPDLARSHARMSMGADDKGEKEVAAPATREKRSWRHRQRGRRKVVADDEEEDTVEGFQI